MRTTSVKDLPVKITAAEKAYKSDQLVQKLAEISDLEEQKKRESSATSQAIKEGREVAARLAREVRLGEEVRPVECFERPLYGDMVVELVRCDTGAVVETRGMHPSERQKAMEFDGASVTVLHPAGKRKTKAEKSAEAELEAARRVNDATIEEPTEDAETAEEKPKRGRKPKASQPEHTEH